MVVPACNRAFRRREECQESLRPAWLHETLSQKTNQQKLATLHGCGFFSFSFFLFSLFLSCLESRVPCMPGRSQTHCITLNSWFFCLYLAGAEMTGYRPVFPCLAWGNLYMDINSAILVEIIIWDCIVSSVSCLGWCCADLALYFGEIS